VAEAPEDSAPPVAELTLESFGARVRAVAPEEMMRPAFDVLAMSGARVVSGGSGEPPASSTFELDAVIECRPPCSGGAGAVLRDGEVVATSRDQATLGRVLLSELHLAVAANARHGLFVHAAAVAWRGVGIVIPARSMAGKSTLVRALVAAGADYYSDEYAVLDTTGRLHPYHKPISIRSTPETGGTASEVVGVGLVGRLGTEPVPVHLVVSTSYRPGDGWSPTTLNGAASTLVLVENTVAARRVPETMLAVVAAVAGSARIVSGARPDADTAARHILVMADEIVDGAPDLSR